MVARNEKNNNRESIKSHTAEVISSGQTKKALNYHQKIVKLKEFYEVDLNIKQNENKPIGKFDIRILKTFADFYEDRVREEKN